MANSTREGSVVITVDMDVSDAEKELTRLKRKIVRLEDALGERAFQRSGLSAQLTQAKKQLEKLRAEKPAALVDGKAADKTAYTESLAAAEKAVSKLDRQIQKIEEDIRAGERSLSYTAMRYGEILPLARQMRTEAESRTAAENQAQADEQRRAQIAREAQAAAEARIAQQRLLDIKESAAVADQRLVDMQGELLRLTQRKKELESAGVGLGYREYDGISKRITGINAELREYQDNLIAPKAKTGSLKKDTNAVGEAMGRLGRSMAEMADKAVFSKVISKGMAALQQITMRYIKTNDGARQAIAQIKGALLTLAQPLIEIIIPAFTAFLSVLARGIAAAASLVSSLFGKTVQESAAGAEAMNKEADAVAGVGEAAEEASGSLAGFDEINQIDTEEPKGGGGAPAEIGPDFSWMDGKDAMVERLKEIVDLVGLVAAGLLLWKIGTMLPGVLGQMATKLGGILLIIGGLLLFWHGLTDAWENGVDWLNLIEMIGGLAAAAAGLYITLGPIAAGIALLVGGLLMLATAFHDAMENGWNLQNIILAIAGILGTGLGIAMLAGSWIPLLIAAVAAVLLAVTIATGHGEELLQGVRTMMEGFIEFFTGIFSGDIDRAVGGITQIFEGLKTALFAVIDGLKDSLLSFLDWLDEKTGGRFHGIIETVKLFVTGFFDVAKSTLGGILDAFKQTFSGITQFLTGVFTNDWDLAWEGVKNIFKGVWNGNISLLEGAVNLIIKGINTLISRLNRISIDIPDNPITGAVKLGFHIPSIPEAEIPRLARGAVIPPNREFMAVLGDQPSGMNIEAPEDLIRKIVREEAGGGDGQVVMLLQSLLEAVRAGQVITVDKAVLGRTARDGINDITMKSGKFALLF